MLALYPSNKLEHLSFLLTTLLTQQPTAVFTPETILVESPGMQHWVSMQLAHEQGVAMNIDFPLPVRFMWNTARTVLGSDSVPRQSPYRREVLMWRIDAILQDESVMSAPTFEQVNRYWVGAGSEQEQGVQRLQLATALADVYEQYLLYRPDWLFAWENNAHVVGDAMEVWQSEIWRLLVKEQPLHPARLHQLTLEALEAGHIPNNLPSRVVVFAINTMAPQLIAFFDALAQHIDIHIFHLNPSVNYWGDAKSDSELAKQLRLEGIEKWMAQEQSNPLLGNLGKQGRELFNLLTELESFEVSAFDAPEHESEDRDGPHTRSLLSYIHRDILHAEPAQALLPHQIVQEDDSIAVMCTHSALREVQVLHDHLLHWLSQDSSRTPSDILVMCPAIENYAPFVDAVFHRVGTKALHNAGTTRLPCSIADRSPMDAEPLIAAYMALLQLPDSRFGVSDIMDYLQLDAVQKRFKVSQDDIDQMIVWLKQAHIHWGLNSQHKAAISEGVTADDTYSWWWGIRRLLTGMLAPDSEMIVNDLLTIPDVEGQSTLTLGKMVEVIDLLGQFAHGLTTPRTPAKWADDLLELRDACFMPTQEQERSWELIAKVAADLAARCHEAGYENELSLRQVRELLLNRFSSPDAGNHFMTGQVTVCSMLPMRSIPFKKVCILGLNDSEFPRKSTPLGLDLMAGPARRVGDRSRRLEDRYLFLEAIISTRESLYLSYQGNDVKNNSERQPSLVLAEFLDMLSTGYQVDIQRYLTHAPLHPFSENAFSGALPSYENGWLRLAQVLREAKQSSNAESNDKQAASHAPTHHNISDGAEILGTSVELNDAHNAKDTRLSAMQVARAFSDPLEYFSIQRLGVNLSQSFTLLENSEPFETNALVRYQVLDALFAAPNTRASATTSSSFGEQVIEFAAMRGDIPNNPVAKEELEMWKEGALALTQAMGPYDATPKTASFTGKYITFTASAFECSESLAALCAGKINDIRALGYFITQLVFCSSDEASSIAGYPLDIYYCDWDKGETLLIKRRFAWMDSHTAQHILLFIEQLYITLYTTPTPLYRSLFSDLVPGKRKSDSAAIVASIKPAMFADLITACEMHNSLIGNGESQGATDTYEHTQEVISVIDNVAALFNSFDAQRALSNWLQSSGRFSADIANNPYVKWLFPQGIEWQVLPHIEGFLLFAMVANAGVEEKL
ncbi:exodeoxyribonuclease V subunit gamma [Alteromonas sp. 345S023]|uniref:RecBCD enzyme subunit RecC n=1 Tax=Alteromonas profundi TaxID=2696062 RepID=A0A7X5LJR6_9ALTE|nr:exodeoxyribonuclease V subunit gamma [Alteromonas profundi]NDV90651.1 exodeoxyribonuclease V subunit gamma [Alteromonas profundi]